MQFEQVPCYMPARMDESNMPVVTPVESTPRKWIRILAVIIWFGPVVWIGVAIFEELTHLFMLHHLGHAFTLRGAKWVVVVIAAAIFAGGHLYQGPAGMAGNLLLGLVKGALYIKLRRFWPFVIAHALWDTLQISTELIQIQRDMGG